MRRELKKINSWLCCLRLSHRKSHIVNRYKGLTLTEVVTASALLLVVMVPILKALTSAQVNTEIIERKTRSLILAQAKLENIKARSIFNYDNSFTETNTPLDGSYLCTVIDSGATSDLRQITAKVGYDLDDSGILEAQEIDVTLTTLIARRWQE